MCDQSNFELIGMLYEHFGLPVTKEGTIPHLLDEATTNFRYQFLREELHELAAGYEQEDLAQIADALVDLVVVALGTAHLHGLPWEELFAEVMSSAPTWRSGAPPTLGRVSVAQPWTW
jgi:hypothetical protein